MGTHSADECVSPPAVNRSAAIEQLARLAEGEGFSRIGSRMLALLTVAATPQSIDALARRLEVSRASISTNGALLRSLGLIERVVVLGDRRDYLQVRGDSAGVLLTLGVKRLHTMREMVRALRTAVPRNSGDRARLGRMERLYDTLVARLQRELHR